MNIVSLSLLHSRSSEELICEDERRKKWAQEALENTISGSSGAGGLLFGFQANLSGTRDHSIGGRPRSKWESGMNDMGGNGYIGVGKPRQCVFPSVSSYSGPNPSLE